MPSTAAVGTPSSPDQGAHVRVQRVAVAAIAAAAFFTGCATDPSVFEDATVDADIAVSAGEAMAASIAEMIANEAAASLPLVAGGGPTANATTVSRSRICYDAADAVVANCSPMSSVRKIVTNLTIDGTREGTRPDAGGSWTGAVHRVMSDTTRRDFNTATPPAEVSRTHSGVTTGNDTTTFVQGDFTRKASEALRDTVKALKFNLPRASNPWPASGSIVRVTTVKVTVTKGTRSESRDLTRRVTITFPADAQGNVVLTVNETTCNLNLVTRRVTDCER
jgi:hypothetical protein